MCLENRIRPFPWGQVGNEPCTRCACLLKLLRQRFMARDSTTWALISASCSLTSVAWERKGILVAEVSPLEEILRTEEPRRFRRNITFRTTTQVKYLTGLEFLSINPTGNKHTASELGLQHVDTRMMRGRMHKLSHCGLAAWFFKETETFLLLRVVSITLSIESPDTINYTACPLQYS